MESEFGCGVYPRSLFERDPNSLGDGESEKRIGMDRAKRNRRDLLETARQIAREIALSRESRSLTMDAVITLFRKRGHDPQELGPAAGSVFSGRDWSFTGERVNSQRVKNHARELKVWRYRGKGS
jgi:hypothetical protein